MTKAEQKAFEPINGLVEPKAAVVEGDVLAVRPALHLGSLAIRSPKDLVAQATEMAEALSEVIHAQQLYKVINGKKYVLCEGWTTLGAMMGVVPIEESCVPMTDDGGKSGFLAKVKLIRAADSGQVGGASAECTRSESSWTNRNSYALHSMAITRATGKAFRLSYSWIMKLAGFQPTPAEEMIDAEPPKAEQDAAFDEAKNRYQTEKGKKEVLGFTPGDAGMTYISGKAALELLKLRISEQDKALVIWLPNSKKNAIPNDQVEKFFGLCEKAGIEPKIVPAAPNGTAAAPSVAVPSKTALESQLEASIPMIRSSERSETKKHQVFLKVRYGTADATSTLHCFKADLFPYLEAGAGKPASLIVQKVKDYQNIMGIERIGDQTFSLNQDEKYVPDIQNDEPPLITDEDLPAEMFPA